MLNVVYIILILGVAILSIISGFRKGITGQLSSLLGFGFGSVTSRLLTEEYTSTFQWTHTFSQAQEFSDFTSNLVCAVVIYLIVFLFFSIFSPIFRRLLWVVPVGIFNRLLGCFFSLLKNMLWLSIFFNLVLCFSPSSGLLRYEKANDGNLVAAVIALTPAILGCFGGEDFAHFNQLKEAKSISCNFHPAKDVILSQG